MERSDLNSLKGIALRSAFGAVRAKLGEPESADRSPDGEFGTYSWPTHGVSVLTWLNDGDELVWGVRLDGPGSSDAVLGFGVGSQRKAVLDRVRPRSSEGNVVEVALDDGRLIIQFDEDRVSTIQLMAPMG